MTGPIAKNATIADVLPDLVAKEDYVCRVLKTMLGFKADNPVVTIGVTGGGSYPQYRILSHRENGGEAIFGTYNDNGTEMPTARASVLPWSTGRMTLEEVKQLLGAIRQKERPASR